MLHLKARAIRRGSFPHRSFLAPTICRNIPSQHPIRAAVNASSSNEDNDETSVFLSPARLETLEKLRSSMNNTASAYILVCISNLALSAFQASGSGREGEEGEALVAEGSKEAAVVLEGLTVGDLAYWADSLIVVLLIYFSLKQFEQIKEGGMGNQIDRVFRGLTRLELVFEQLAIGSYAVTTVTALEAAVKFPPIVVFASGSFFGLALIRAAAMSYVLNAHTSEEEVSRTLKVVRDSSSGSAKSSSQSLVDNVAVWLAFGLLVGFEEEKKDKPKKDPSAQKTLEYEFSPAEEKVVKNMTQSTQAAGLAILLQAFSTYVLATAEFGAGDYPGVLSNGINATNKALMAWLVFQACGSFDRALHTDDGEDDLAHLFDGLGSHGLTEFFDKLSILAWATSFAQVVGICLPWIEHNILGSLAADGSSHAAAEAVVEGLEEGIKILEQL